MFMMLSSTTNTNFILFLCDKNKNNSDFYFHSPKIKFDFNSAVCEELRGLLVNKQTDQEGTSRVTL